MSSKLGEIMNRLFLGYRPSIGLSFFRIFVALTVGLHVIPSFMHLQDNYLQGAYKSVNLNFFTPWAVELIQKSPDWMVYAFVAGFMVTWLAFLIGLFSQVGCILLTACCYYFYALNCFHIGTLSWDILLVTMFLMCVSPYHGDYFSLDALRGDDVGAYRRSRPYFVQRLLQMQIASTYFYTALYKITGPGNWLSDNPVYYLLNNPAEGVTKAFIGREFFAAHSGLCYGIGIAIVCSEILLPVLLFIPRTRVWAIGLGWFFHVVLILTLHVPTIFFFLFPAQLLLFIDPRVVVRWIEKKREDHGSIGRDKVVYDGHCRFCAASMTKLLIMDMFGTVIPVNSHALEDLSKLHPKLTKELSHSQLYLVTPSGDLLGGFYIFRRLCWKIPMLYPLIPVFYFPGSSLLGPMVYRWVAKNRYLLHRNKDCRDNSCFVG